MVEGVLVEADGLDQDIHLLDEVVVDVLVEAGGLQDKVEGTDAVLGQSDCLLDHHIHHPVEGAVAVLVQGDSL